jgi:hypothetical protein
MGCLHRRWIGSCLGAALVLGCRSSSAENHDPSSPATVTAQTPASQDSVARAEGGGQTENAKAPSVAGELVYVTKVQAPFALLEGDVLTVTLAGNLPTPAWKLSGVDVSVDPRAGRIRLTPRATPPAEGTMSIQVLQPFDTKAEVKGLAAGSYTLQVESRDRAATAPARVDVLPKSALVFVRSRGGIAGLDRSCLVTTDQLARATSSRSPDPVEKRLDDAAFGDLKGLVAALGNEGRTAQSNRGADLRTHWIAWATPHGLVLTVVDDGTQNDAERALVERLSSLASS